MTESNKSNQELKKGVEGLQDLRRRKLPNLAVERANELLRQFPGNPAVRAILSQIYHEINDFNSAAEILEELIKDDPERYELRGYAAMSWLGAGRTDMAVQRAKEAMEFSPESDQARILLTEVFERSNQADQAWQVLEEITETDENRHKIQVQKCRLYIQAKRWEDSIQSGMDALKSIEAMDEDANSSLKGLGNDIRFQLAKAYDRSGDYDAAWAMAADAHRIDGRVWPREQMLADEKQTREFMNRDTLKALARNPDATFEPLFIVGSPRSGTSLLEQILSMHPDIANGGEMSISSTLIQELPLMTDSYLPWPSNIFDLRVDDAEKLGERYRASTAMFNEGRKIVSNKSLALYLHMGFLSLILPGSRAIMIHRHPLDNAVSCYTTNLIASGHVYTNTLEALAEMWIQRREMQDFWLENLDIPVMDLHYENLVGNQEEESRRLIEFLGLPWEPKCLEFHTSTNVARTISYDQVNKKMYKTSKGRWSNYEKHLGPLIDAFDKYL